jgi:hypothetical protein
MQGFKAPFSGASQASAKAGFIFLVFVLRFFLLFLFPTSVLGPPSSVLRHLRPGAEGEIGAANSFDLCYPG